MVDSFCAVAKPIHPSRRDTDETIRQIIAHNQIGIDKCGWGTSPPVPKFPGSEPATPPD